MSKRGISQSIQKPILTYSALGILIIGITVAAASITPLYTLLKKNEERNIFFGMRTKTMAVEEYVSKTRNIALQITSRTRIRDYLTSYNKGEITLHELVSFSKPKIIDAMNISEEIKGVSRLDAKGNLVIQTGIPVPEYYWPIPDKGSMKVLIKGPIMLEGESYIIIRAPILNRLSVRQGTDIVLFSLSAPLQILRDYSGLGRTGETILAKEHNGNLLLFCPLRRTPAGMPEEIPETSPLGSIFKKGIYGNSGISSAKFHGTNVMMAYGPVKGTEWGIMVKMDKEELYAPLKLQVIITGGIVFLLILFGTLGLVLMLRPLIKALQRELEERKKVEEHLQEAHRRLLTILEGIDALIYVADLETYELLFVNKYGRDIFGDIRDSICWKVLQSGQTAPCDFCTNKYLLDSEGQPKEPYTWEFQNTVDGRWYYISDRAIRWIDGRLVRLEIATDITERKTLEEERQRSHKLESVGTLAGGIAHDFNNLLAATLNNIYLSKMQVDRESTVYKKLEAAEKVLYRASDLTRQLLTFSRGGEPIKRITSVTEIIKESASFVLRGSNVKCEFAKSDNLWPAEVDAGQISQVVNNLILNAAQAMPEGGIIRINTQNLMHGSGTELPLPEGRYIKFTIQDQGIGIPEEHLQTIFDPYFSTKEMGRGLGLAIVYTIVKNHDGHISVKSELGVGTTVTICLPASEEQPVSEEDIKDEIIPGKGKILIMDDEEMIRASLGEMLTLMGYDVEFAYDGVRAIDLYKRAMETSQPFNAVILDLTIPGGMGGEAVIKKLINIDPNVKAIASSGYSNDPVMQNFRAYGFLDIIEKPFKSPEALSILLHKLIVSSI